MAATAAATLAIASPASAGTISGDQGTTDVTLGGTGQTWDLTTATFTQSGYTGGDFPVRITGTDLTINGGKVTGDYPSSKTWWDLKQTANGGAFLLDNTATGNYTFNSPWAKNIAVDMFRVASAPSSVTFNNVYSEVVRDDIFSLSRKSDGSTRYAINDALVEGYTGISWRHTGPGADAPFKLAVNGLVMHIKPQALSSGSCSTWMTGGLGNGSPFKMDSYKGSTSNFLIKDAVIWVERGNRDTCSHYWPTATYDNVTVVWTGSGSIPGGVPAGVKLTTDRSVYDAARQSWIDRHSGTSTTSATTSPTSSPSPSPTATSSPTPTPTATSTTTTTAPVAAVAVKQLASGTDSDGSTRAKFGSATTGGHLLVATTGENASQTGVVKSFKDSAGNTWRRAIRRTSADGKGAAEVWYATNAKSVTWVQANSAKGRLDLRVVEYGTSKTFSVAATATKDNSSTTQHESNTVSAAASDIVVAALTYANVNVTESNSSTDGLSSVADVKGGSSPGRLLATAQGTASGAASFQAVWTTSASIASVGVIAALRAA